MTDPNWRLHCKNTSVAIDLNRFGLLEISGPDSETFLQGQLTCDLNELTPNIFSFAAYCERKGRIIANFYIYRDEDRFFLLMPKSMLELCQLHLNKYAIFSKVELAISHTHIVGLIAPHHIDLIQLAPFGLSQQQDCRILALPGELTRVILQGSTEAISAFLATQNLTLANDKTHWWQWLDIENCMTFIEPATSTKFTPQMIALEKWGGVSFSKGCYLGQEVIARTQHLGKLKRHLQRAEVKSTHMPEPGDALSNQEGEVLGLVAQATIIEDDHYALLAVIQDRAHEHDLFLKDNASKIIL